jgi:hypothetical protein
MTVQLFTNDASALLSVGISASDTSLTVTSGGSLFPSPTGTDYFILSLETAAGAIEYVKCTGRTGNVFSPLVRGQESSTAIVFAAGSRVELRATAGTLNGFFQKAAPVLGAALDANNFNIVNIANVDADTATIGVIDTTGVRSTDNNASNQLAVPTGGGPATAGGSVIITQANAAASLPTTSKFPAGGIIMWSGSIGSIPTGWLLCDGTSGTPDLRDRFVVGAGTTYAVAATGGAAATGNSTTGASAAAHILTEAEIPLHGHPFRVSPLTASTAQSNLTGGLMLNATANVNEVAFTGTPSATLGEQIGGTGGGTGHTHTLTDPGHTHSNLPPYYALAYIMKAAY